MGFVIRRGFFETNSSSTHAIVVSHKKLKIEKSDLYTSWGDYNFEFGRDIYRLLDGWDYKLAYIYLVLLDSKSFTDPVIYPDNIDINKFKSKVSEIFNRDILPIIDDDDYNTIKPDNIFDVIDFIHSGKSGKTPNFESVPLFDTMLNSKYSYIGVDHTEDFFIFKDTGRRFGNSCYKFLEKILSDDEYLKKFLFSRDSYITIGSDEEMGYNLKTLGFENDYDDDNEWNNRVDKYKKTHDVYFKGN